jgi:hypothetical protein
VQLRDLSLVTDLHNFWRYQLSGDPIRVPIPKISEVQSAADDFWKNVCQSIQGANKPDCARPPADSSAKSALIRQVVLWTMYKHQRSDISLLQERDFYVNAVEDYLADHCKTKQNPLVCDKDSVKYVDFQEVLDRILWKGDYIQLRLVPGSVLKSIMKQSESYSKVEKGAYLPVEEAGRALVTLGLTPDAKNGGDYLINQKPIPMSFIP